jgi:flagellar biosynthesis/type III secretory pathway protein FliH
MSSSKPVRTVQATAWALDELALPDIFGMPIEPMHTSMHGAMSGSMQQAYDEEDAVTHAINAEANAEAAQAALIANAYSRGRAEGAAAAQRETEATLTSALAALTSAVEMVRLHDAKWTSNAEENIAALATMVARHLVQREVVADPSIVRDLVQRALSQFPIDQIISVRLHPEDVAACGVLLAPDAAGRTRDVRWISDAHILRGGCLVEGRERIIDGRVDTSLERAYRAIGQVQA